MPEGLNELEAALRQLQPAPVVQGPLLIEMGRAAAARSARKWRWLSMTTSTIAAVLAGLLVLRPEPATEVRIVYLPAIAPSEESRDTSDEPTSPIEPALPTWRLRQHQVALTVARISDGGDDEPAALPRSLRAADLMRDPSLWSSSTNSGAR